MINIYKISHFISAMNVYNRRHYKSMYITPNHLILQYLELFKFMGIIISFYYVNDNTIEIFFKYRSNKTNLGAFLHMKLISKPSKRIFVDIIKLQKLKNRWSKSYFILNTTKGLKLDIDCLKENIGGEVMLLIRI